MVIGLTLIVIASLLFFGLKTACAAANGHSCGGHRTLTKMSKWQKRQPDIWSVFPMKQLLAVTARLVFLDIAAATRLGKSLGKAGLGITPQEYTGRKYLIIASGVCMMALCFALNFYFGTFIVLMGTVFALMKQRDTLNARVKKKELAVSQEMPRFIRTICRSLQSDRDLYNVVAAYRKAAGPELSEELDILLAEMKSGNVQSSFVHFENRLGTSEVTRLCSALRDMSMGIDQTATLSYMADDMARQAKENVKRELSLRPGKMRRTYYPAIGICIAMIMYVLVVYVINNLNSIM